MRTAPYIVACLCTILPPATAAQSVLERTPNLSGGWSGEPGTIYFNFLHRFTTSAAPERQVSNTPTFLLAYAPLGKVLAGVNYATRSDLSPRFPNEYELFARYQFIPGLAVQAAYNNAGRSVDAEVSVSRSIDRLRLLGAARAFSNGYDADSARFAVAGGATLRLTRSIALAGDVATLINRTASERMAWGAALQLAIPTTPHTLSLQVANTNTATLEGAARGSAQRRYGFEFTIPLHLARFKGAHAVAQPVPDNATRVAMKNLQFAPQTLTIARGTTVAWKNEDPLAHTVTASDKSWTSPLLQPGATYVHKFDVAGRYEIQCTPHPFMKMVVEVQP
ncbi:MAG TPA: cupredoxin family copper-binding protein [Longimicrobiales bacterium]